MAKAAGPESARGPGSGLASDFSSVGRDVAPGTQRSRLAQTSSGWPFQYCYSPSTPCPALTPTWPSFQTSVPNHLLRPACTELLPGAKHMQLICFPIKHTITRDMVSMFHVRSLRLRDETGCPGHKVADTFGPTWTPQPWPSPHPMLLPSRVILRNELRAKLRPALLLNLKQCPGSSKLVPLPREASEAWSQQMRGWDMRAPRILHITLGT